MYKYLQILFTVLVGIVVSLSTSSAQLINNDIESPIDSTINFTDTLITYLYAYPNPFRTNTTVEYTIDDKVMLTAILYDANGREVDVVMSNQPVKRGTYSLELQFPETATNGMFNLLLQAEAINNKLVDNNHLILKLQKVH